MPLTSSQGGGGSGSGKYSPLYAVVHVPADDDVVSLSLIVLAKKVRHVTIRRGLHLPSGSKVGFLLRQKAPRRLRQGQSKIERLPAVLLSMCILLVA